jgi:hypothetical protein
MKRKALLVVPALAAFAAIVVLTTGALAGAAGRSDQPNDGFAACLASHGVQVPSDDPAAVKQWLGGRSQDDRAVQAALDACAGPTETGSAKTGGGDDTGESGPMPAELVACLEQHRVAVPSEVKATPDALKPWLIEAMKQPSVRAAADGCTGGPAPSGQKK